MQVIIHSEIDSISGEELCAVTPVPEELTVEDVLNHPIFLGKDCEVVDSSTIPTDRYFRNAWRKRSSGVEISLPEARALKMNNLRKERDEELKRLDIEQLKGVDVTAEKQVLRDMPTITQPVLDSITDLEELKNYQPKILKRSR